MPEEATPASALFPAIYAYLVEAGLSKTAKAMQLEAALGAAVPPAEPGMLACFKGLATVSSTSLKRKLENGTGENGGVPASKKAKPAPVEESDEDDDGAHRSAHRLAAPHLF